MKKNLLYLFTVLCTLSFFASCSKDDDEPNYSGTYSGEKLSLTLSGTALDSKELSIDNTTATFKSVIPGEPALAIPVTFAGTTFTGVSKTDTREVKVEGAIVDGVAKVTVSLNVTSPLVGSTYFTNAQSLSLDFATPKETITFMGDPNYKAEYLPDLLGMMGGAMLGQYLQSVTFNANGNITASYSSAAGSDAVTSPEGYAIYNVVGDQIFVSVNLAMIMGKQNVNPLEGLMTLVSNGIPLTLKIDGKKASFTLTRTTMLPVMQVLPALSGMIPEELKSLVGEMATIVNESTKFDLSLNLEKK